MKNQRITSEELNWVGVDFDNTLCENSGMPDFLPTTIIKGSKHAMEEIVKAGFKPVIFTARPWSEFHLIKDWLEENQIPFKTIICGKPLMRVMIDDRNIEFDGDWSKALAKIK